MNGSPNVHKLEAQIKPRSYKTIKNILIESQGYQGRKRYVIVEQIIDVHLRNLESN